MNNQKIYLFYCNRCTHSKNLIAKMKSLNIIDNPNYKIIKCDIDNKRLAIPPQIKVVPTIFITSSNGPNVGAKIIVNPELDAWVDEFAKSSGGGQMAQPNNHNQAMDPQMDPRMDNRGVGGMQPNIQFSGMISDFDAAEMGSGYASITDEAHTVTGNMQYINGNGDFTSHPMERGRTNQTNPKMTGLGESQEGNGKDIKKNELDKRFEDLMAVREMDMQLNQPPRYS